MFTVQMFHKTMFLKSFVTVYIKMFPKKITVFKLIVFKTFFYIKIVYITNVYKRFYKHL